MEDLFIQGTNSKPTISFKNTGEISFEGRALIEDAFAFFQPLFLWADQSKFETLNCSVNLEYFNTSFSKQLLDLLKMFDDNTNNKVINLKWLYEEGDDEMLETGEIYQDLLPRFNFTFEEYAEVLE